MRSKMQYCRYLKFGLKPINKKVYLPGFKSLIANMYDLNSLYTMETTLEPTKVANYDSIYKIHNILIVFIRDKNVNMRYPNSCQRHFYPTVFTPSFSIT